MTDLEFWQQVVIAAVRSGEYRISGAVEAANIALENKHKLVARDGGICET